MKIFPDLQVMKANHDSFVPEAKRHGAKGMMITVWGDMGHMNLTGLETCPLAYGACNAWQDEHEDESFKSGRLWFESAYSWSVYRDLGNAGVVGRSLDMINRLKGVAGLSGVGFLLFFSEPLQSTFLDKNSYDPSILQDLEVRIKSDGEHLAAMEDNNSIRRRLWLDNHMAFLQAEVIVKKLQLIEYLSSDWPGTKYGDEVFDEASFRCREIAGRVATCLAMLESRWLLNSKQSGLEVNRQRYRRLIDAWIARAWELSRYSENMQKGQNPPSPDKVFLNSPAGYVFNMIEEMGLLGLI
jgi:hypothetical protein